MGQLNAKREDNYQWSEYAE